MVSEALFYSTAIKVGSWNSFYGHSSVLAGNCNQVLMSLAFSPFKKKSTGVLVKQHAHLSSVDIRLGQLCAHLQLVPTILGEAFSSSQMLQQDFWDELMSEIITAGFTSLAVHHIQNRRTSPDPQGHQRPNWEHATTPADHFSPL